MYTLLLMRHAKSSWDDPDLADEDRPLNKRGKAAAEQMGKFLRARHLVPYLIVTSPAKRARQTAKRLSQAGGFEAPVIHNKDLYLSGPGAYLNCIGVTRESVKNLLIIGHNPDLETLVGKIAGHEERMPTAAIAHIEISSEDWRGVRDPASRKLVAVYRPKELTQAD